MIQQYINNNNGNIYTACQFLWENVDEFYKFVDIMPLKHIGMKGDMLSLNIIMPDGKTYYMVFHEHEWVIKNNFGFMIKVEDHVFTKEYKIYIKEIKQYLGTTGVYAAIQLKTNNLIDFCKFMNIDISDIVLKEGNTITFSSSEDNLFNYEISFRIGDWAMKNKIGFIVRITNPFFQVNFQEIPS